jgi:phosphoglycolate phosphatase
MQIDLIFDLDGTLTDPSVGITRCYIHALRALGREPPTAAELERHIGPPMRSVLAELLGTHDADEVETGVRIYRERFSTVGLFENAPYPGIADALAQLRSRGYRLFVCTSKPEVYALRIVQHFKLAEYFQRIYGCELDGTRGEKTELLAYLLERESVEPSSAVMIGDRLHDVRAAKANGLRSVGVLYGFGSAAELERAGADVLCPSVSDLPAVIERFSFRTG